MTNETVRLVIVMPVFNEEECIRSVVENWVRVVRQINGSRILLIDDGSTDRSGDILDILAGQHKQIKVFHQRNRGHGSAVIAGYRIALDEGMTHIFQADSDDQIPAEEFWKLWARREESPFILGWRRRRHDPIHRIIISALSRLLVKLLFRVTLKDPNIPFRLIHARFLSDVLPRIETAAVFTPNIYLSIFAALNGVDTLDVEIAHDIRKSGIPSLKPIKLVKVCFRCLREMISMRFHN